MNYKIVRDRLITAENELTRYYLSHGCAITDASVQRDFEHMIEDLSLGQNFVHFDDAGTGQPAIYWTGPPAKERYHSWLSENNARYQVKDTLPLHQSFYISNANYDWYQAKYLMGSVNGVNKPVSLRGLLPARNLTIVSGQALAKSRGANDSICTWAVYDFMSKWAERKQFDPYGNTIYGMDDRANTLKGDSQHVYPDNNFNQQGLTLTGSMGDMSSLDGTCFTPHDLVGNVWEFAIGKMTDKYIFMIPQNNAALLAFGTAGSGLEMDSAEYKKISDTLGSYIERTVSGGLLYDFIDEIGGYKPYCISNVQNHAPVSNDNYGAMSYTDLTVRDVERFAILEQNGLIKGSNGQGVFRISPGGVVYNRFMEGYPKIELKGGSCSNGGGSRLRASEGNHAVSNSYWHFGLRLELVRKC